MKRFAARIRKTDVIWVDDRSDANESSGFHSMEKHPMCVMVAVAATSCGLFSKRRRSEWSRVLPPIVLKTKVNGYSDRKIGPRPHTADKMVQKEP